MKLQKNLTLLILLPFLSSCQLTPLPTSSQATTGHLSAALTLNTLANSQTGESLRQTLAQQKTEILGAEISSSQTAIDYGKIVKDYTDLEAKPYVKIGRWLSRFWFYTKIFLVVGFLAQGLASVPFLSGIAGILSIFGRGCLAIATFGVTEITTIFKFFSAAKPNVPTIQKTVAVQT